MAHRNSSECCSACHHMKHSLMRQIIFISLVRTLYSCIAFTLTYNVPKGNMSEIPLKFPQIFLFYGTRIFVQNSIKTGSHMTIQNYYYHAIKIFRTAHSSFGPWWTFFFQDPSMGGPAKIFTQDLYWCAKFNK